MLLFVCCLVLLVLRYDYYIIHGSPELVTLLPWLPSVRIKTTMSTASQSLAKIQCKTAAPDEPREMFFFFLSEFYAEVVIKFHFTIVNFITP